MRVTTEVIKKATTLYRQGVAFAEIGKALGCTDKQVAQIITQIKITTARPKNQVEKQQIRERILLGNAVEAISEELGIESCDVAAIARHMQVKGQVEEVETTTMNNPMAGYRGLIEVASQLQKALKDTEPTQREVDIHILSDKPIMIVCMSDWHLGSIHTDMHKILDVIDYVKKTPNAYCFFGGDIFDAVGAASKHQSILHEQLLQPSVTRRIAQGMFHDLGDKLLAFVAGCHDTWLQDAVDLDQVAEMSSSPYLGHGGACNIWLGEQVYRIGLRHKFSGSTAQSIFNSNKAYLMKVDATADVVIIGHHHVSGTASEVWQGKERLFVRTGSAKSIDRYAAQLGLAPTRDGEVTNSFPCIILHPNQRMMQGFNDWESCKDYFGAMTRNP